MVGGELRCPGRSVWLCIVPCAGPTGNGPLAPSGTARVPSGAGGGETQPVVSSRMRCPGGDSQGHLLGVRGSSGRGRVSSLGSKTLLRRASREERHGTLTKLPQISGLGFLTGQGCGEEGAGAQPRQTASSLPRPTPNTSCRRARASMRPGDLPAPNQAGRSKGLGPHPPLGPQLHTQICRLCSPAGRQPSRSAGGDDRLSPSNQGVVCVWRRDEPTRPPSTRLPDSLRPDLDSTPKPSPLKRPSLGRP